MSHCSKVLEGAETEQPDELDSESQPMAWVSDSSSNKCFCGSKFTSTYRRHHCRACGCLVCNKCSLSRKPVPAYKNEVRVCDPCAGKPPRVRSRRSKSAGFGGAAFSLLRENIMAENSRGETYPNSLFSKPAEVSNPGKIVKIQLDSLPPVPSNVPMELPNLKDPTITLGVSSFETLDDRKVRLLVAAEKLGEFYTPKHVGGLCVHYLFPGERGEMEGLEIFDLIWRVNKIQGPTTKEFVDEKKRVFSRKIPLLLYIYNYKTQQYRQKEFSFEGFDTPELGLKVLPINYDVHSTHTFRNMVTSSNVEEIPKRESTHLLGVTLEEMKLCYPPPITNVPLPPIDYHKGYTNLTKKMKEYMSEGKTEKQALILDAVEQLSIIHTPYDLPGLLAIHIYPGEVGEQFGFKLYDLIYRINSTIIETNHIATFIRVLTETFKEKRTITFYLYSYMDQNYRTIEIDMKNLAVPTMGLNTVPIVLHESPLSIPENQEKYTEAWTQIGESTFVKIQGYVPIFARCTLDNENVVVPVWESRGGNSMVSTGKYSSLYNYEGISPFFITFWKKVGPSSFVSKGEYIQLPRRPF